MLSRSRWSRTGAKADRFGLAWPSSTEASCACRRCLAGSAHPDRQLYPPTLPSVDNLPEQVAVPKEAVTRSLVRLGVLLTTMPDAALQPGDLKQGDFVLVDTLVDDVKAGKLYVLQAGTVPWWSAEQSWTGWTSSGSCRTAWISSSSGRCWRATPASSARCCTPGCRRDADVRAAAYVRVSSDPQLEKFGPDSQKHAIEIVVAGVPFHA